MSRDFSLTPIKLTTTTDHHTLVLRIFKLFENSSNLPQSALKIKVKRFFFCTVKSQEPEATSDVTHRIWV